MHTIRHILHTYVLMRSVACFLSIYPKSLSERARRHYYTSCPMHDDRRRHGVFTSGSMQHEYLLREQEHVARDENTSCTCSCTHPGPPGSKQNRKGSFSILVVFCCLPPTRHQFLIFQTRLYGNVTRHITHFGDLVIIVSYLPLEHWCKIQLASIEHEN